MKRWLALLLSVALLGAPCLTAGAAGIAEVKEDFEGYASTEEVKNNWFFAEGVVDADRGIKTGSITLEQTTGMEGLPTQAVKLTAERVEGVDSQRDVYFQKDGVDFTGEVVTSFRIRIGEDEDFRQVLWRESTSGGTSFINVINMYGQKLRRFDQDVMDPETGEQLLLERNVWHDFAIVSTQTVGSREIPYKLYINGELLAENTYTAGDQPRTFVNTVRFDHRFDNDNVSEYDTMTTEFDDIFITKMSALTFDNMTSTPANGDASVAATSGTIQVDFGTRMNTATITKDQLTLMQDFEGQTTEITDYELIPSAMGMQLIMPGGAFVEEATYTLTIGDVCDFRAICCQPKNGKFRLRRWANLMCRNISRKKSSHPILLPSPVPRYPPSAAYRIQEPLQGNRLMQTMAQALNLRCLPTPLNPALGWGWMCRAAACQIAVWWCCRPTSC